MLLGHSRRRHPCPQRVAFLPNPPVSSCPLRAQRTVVRRKSWGTEATSGVPSTSSLTNSCRDARNRRNRLHLPSIASPSPVLHPATELDRSHGPPRARKYAAGRRVGAAQEVCQAVYTSRRRRLPRGRGRQQALAAPRAKATSPAAAAAEQAVEYVRSEDLQLVAGPKARAASLVAEIDSKDWVKVCEELNDARRLAIHHPALLGPILRR